MLPGVSRTLRDPYEVLGVQRDASPDTLKAAYRQKALRYHPDRNPGDREAEERFKEVSEAYAILRDPDARARYDRYGAQQPATYRHDTSNVDWRDVFREADIHVDWGGQSGVPQTGNAVFDMLFGMMSGVLRQAGMVAGRTYEVRLGLSLGALHDGTEATIAVPGPSVCQTCKGTGRVDASQVGGRSPGPFEATSAPQSAMVVCPDCGGRRVRRAGVRLSVRVPAGAGLGGKLRLAGAGEPGNPPGDVLVQVGWAQPQGASANGLDVTGRLTLTPIEAARGADAEFDGVSVTVPKGSRAGDTVVVRGKGLIGQGVSGDLRLTLETAWLEGAARAAGRWLRKLTQGGERK